MLIFTKMDFKKIFTNLKEKRKKNIEKSLEETVENIIQVESEVPSDRYYLLKLKKQYKGLLRSAKSLKLETTSYETKLNQFYQKWKKNLVKK